MESFKNGKGAPCAANDDVEPADEVREGFEEVFCKSFWHKWAKRRIYAPPGRAFRFLVAVKR